jgi:hypothetical protein
LEVGLSFPEELHDLHSDLTLAPENENLQKFLTTLYNKKKYVVLYIILKQYLKWE